MDMTKDLLSSGHSTCIGCGEVIAVRMLLKSLGKNCIICQATGCMEITTSPYPKTAWLVPWIHVTFENAAAVASGISRALKKQGKEATVVAMGGDGGMGDIGFQAMSGALERNEDILIVCTDNECYANTGIQRSALTPLYASTTTSPAGRVIPGKSEWKKPFALICAAHGAPYVATASISYPEDLQMKVKKAKVMTGSRVLHIHCPCPISWRFDPAKTIDIGRLAVETGAFVLYEIENGKFKVTVKQKELKPVQEYIKAQGRFKHLGEEELKRLQELTTKYYEKIISRER